MIDGRNVWRADLEGAFDLLEKAAARLGPQRLMVGPSCSLLHCPIDLDEERSLDAELRGWMAFAKQKLGEIAVLARGLHEGAASIADALGESRERLAARRRSPRIHRPEVKERVQGVEAKMLRRASAYPERRKAQRAALKLPLLPTTTIGSFPQTVEVRKARAAMEEGAMGGRAI